MEFAINNSKINPKVVFPVAKPFKKFKDKNIFYVFDLQHEFLKKFFHRMKSELEN